MTHIVIQGSSYNYKTRETTRFPDRKIYIKRLDSVDKDQFKIILDWCQANMTGYRDSWWTYKTTFYFADQADYLCFLLRWT
jgi:hypothetical protein